MATELALLEHYEEWQQWLPFAVIALGLASVGFALARPGRGALLVLRGVMALFVLSGALGVVLHYRGNAEFELEMDPGLGGFELFRESITGATPALAPAAMAFLGLVGLAATWRHPSFLRD